MTPEEKKELQELRRLLDLLISTDRYTFQKNIQIFNTKNIQLGTGTGTKIGTKATQKLGFYGETPVVQAGAIGDVSGGATQDANVRVAVAAILTALRNIGIIST